MILLYDQMIASKVLQFDHLVTLTFVLLANMRVHEHLVTPIKATRVGSGVYKIIFPPKLS